MALQLPEPGGKTPEVLPKSVQGRYRDLHTLDDVKRHMARACKMLERGKMDAETCRALVYGLKSLAQLMQEMDTERRMAAMEEALAQLRVMKAYPAKPESVR